MNVNQWMIQLSTVSCFETSILPTLNRPWIHVTLNQTSQLNALDLTFFNAFKIVLDALESDYFGGLLMSSSLEKAFCAGGNVKSLLALAEREGELGALQFFTSEYGVDERLYSLRVPYIALIPGICFGGGMGISQSADLRIGLDHTTLSMPEVFIGLFADVGANKFLQHLPLPLRRFLVHAGVRLDASESLQLNLLDATISQASNQEACQTLIQWISGQERELSKIDLKRMGLEGFNKTNHFMTSFAAPPLNVWPELSEILQELEFLGEDFLDWNKFSQFNPHNPWLQKKRPEFSQVCRLSVELQHRLFKNESLSHAEVFKRELELAVAMTLTEEFKQGVRSKLIEKTTAPALFQHKPQFSEKLARVLKNYSL